MVPLDELRVLVVVDNEPDSAVGAMYVLTAV